jgi:heme exporter protein A
VSADRLRLQIDRVSKTYGARRVLGSVSADLAGGDVLLVTGRNGAGKSTLLRIIAGLARPTGGAVRFWWDDRPVADGRRRDVFGFVGPDVHLYRELSAREHVDLVARLRKLPKDGVSGASMLEFVGLAGREDEPVIGFSSGMLQRLRYALALLHAPPVLLLDEPTTNLDAGGIILVDRVVEQMAGNGIVVIATNDQRDMRYGDLVLALDEARSG